mmetsp:Transcript_27026/g.49705  ORF Transcript_27026/g.49705 Transcript_27026/m.49705 type:complete len:312 (-) Transcript_27026:31-966(-)
MSLRCKFGQLPRLHNTGSTTSAFRNTLPGEAKRYSIQAEPCKNSAADSEEVHGDGAHLRRRRRSVSGSSRHYSFSGAFPRKTSPILDMASDRPESRAWHPKKLRSKSSKGIGSIRSAAEHIRANLLSYADSNSCRTVGDVCWALDGSPCEKSQTLKQQSQDLAQRWMYPSNSLDSCVAEDLAGLLAEIMPGTPQSAPGDGLLERLSDCCAVEGGVKQDEYDRSTPTTTFTEDHGFDTRSICTSVESLTDASEVDAKEWWLQRRAKRRQRRKEASKVTYGAVLRGEHEQFLSQQSGGKDASGLSECSAILCT